MSQDGNSCCGYACVQQANVGIIERFGEFADVVPPGCTFVGCLHDLKGQVSLRTRLMHVFTRSATTDKVNVELKTVVMFRVIPAECHTAYYSLSSLNQINSFVDNAVRAEIAEVDFANIFFAKEKISQEVRKALYGELAQRGFEVEEILIRDISVPRELRAASERQLEMKYIRRGNYYRAEMNKIEVTTRAQAESEVKRLQGVGSANMQTGIAGGFGNLMERWETGEQTSEVMAMILMQQYFDTLKSLDQGKGHAVFVPARSIMPEIVALDE